MAKFAQRIEGIPVPNQEEEVESVVETLQGILDNLRGQPTDDSDLKGDCCVCYEGFNTTERKPISAQCGHVVCITCMASGEITTCPKCSEVIEKVIPLFV